MRTFFLVLHALFVIAAATQSAIAQQAVVTVSKGASPRQVQVTIKNGPKACGVQVEFGETRTEKRRIEPGETLTLTHTAPIDSTFNVEVFGARAFQGLFPVSACDFGGAAVFSVAGAEATILHLKKRQKLWAGLPLLTAGGNSNASDSFVIADTAELDSYRDWVVLVNAYNVSMRSTLDGKKKFTDPKSFLSYPVEVCVVSLPGADAGLGEVELRRLAMLEFGNFLGSLTDGGKPRVSLKKCISDEGTNDARLDALTFLMVQRAAVPLLTNSVLGFSKIYERLDVLSHTALQARGQQLRQAEVRQTTAAQLRQSEFDRLADENSLAKVVSMQLNTPKFPSEITFCTLSSEEGLGAAVLGYAYRGLATQSEDFRQQAARVNATFNISKPMLKAYPSLEVVYEVIQTRPNDCLIFVDSPANLKRLMLALQRDRRGYVLNELIDANELRDAWAQRMGYSGFAEHETAREMKVNPQQFKLLAGYQVRDRMALEGVVGEMRTSRYGSGNSITEVLVYLKDRAVALALPNATALSVKASREKAIEEAMQARAVTEALRQKEMAREYPYIAVLTCGMPQHINILACFSGRSGVDTEVKLVNGSSVGLFKLYNLMEAGREMRDGFYIDLRGRFSVRAQNADDTLILGLKIIDRATGRVLREDKAAHFGVVSASN
jgi:hypothetical protein